MTRRKLDPVIQRIPLDKVVIFDVTEAELDALERGTPESLFLNLGVATTSVASSFLVALLTTSINDLRTFSVFVIVTAGGFLAGTTFLGLWWQSRRSLRSVIAEIRRRKPADEPIQKEGESEKPPALE